MQGNGGPTFRMPIPGTSSSPMHVRIFSAMGVKLLLCCGCREAKQIRLDHNLQPDGQRDMKYQNHKRFRHGVITWRQCTGSCVYARTPTRMETGTSTYDEMKAHRVLLLLIDMSGKGDSRDS